MSVDSDHTGKVRRSWLPGDAFWELAFRPGFLLASLFSIIALAIWIAWLSGVMPFLLTGINPLVWHLHEMLFGFTATVATAFILTAVQSWTGLRSLHGPPLAGLCLLWVASRLLLLSGIHQLYLFAVIVQGCWWLMVIAFLTRILVRARNKRNYQFVPLLTVMGCLNLALLLADLSGHTDLALHLGRTALLMFGVLISLVGGRVIPFFTQRGAAEATPRDSIWLNRLLTFFVLASVTAFFMAYFVELPLALTPAPLFIIAGVLHLVRLALWSPLATRGLSLLWSLHLTYLLLGAGLIIMGISYYFPSIKFSDALHLVAVGSVGGMILAMMARVSLGHTGRPLKAPTSMGPAFALIILAAVVRFALPVLGMPVIGWQISASLWGIAFSIFVWNYAKILTAPRAD